MRFPLFYIALASLSGCALAERGDFLIGRECDPGIVASCDAEQKCLPHVYTGPQPDDFRCRDRASFEPLSDGREPPLAFCDKELGFECPGDLVCQVDRARQDVGLRRRVCQRPSNPFGPPS